MAKLKSMIKHLDLEVSHLLSPIPSPIHGPILPSSSKPLQAYERKHRLINWSQAIHYLLTLVMPDCHAVRYPVPHPTKIDPYVIENHVTLETDSTDW